MSVRKLVVTVKDNRSRFKTKQKLRVAGTDTGKQAEEELVT